MVRALTLVLTVLILTAGCGEPAGDRAYRPAPEMGPAEVVRHQVTALGQNAELGDDRGIRIAWRFASPPNREAVGPLPRFKQLLYNPQYRALLDHRGADYQEPVFQNGRAAVAVTVTTEAGREVDYVFFLARHDTDACQGCWLTDAVQPGPDKEPSRGPRVRI